MSIYITCCEKFKPVGRWRLASGTRLASRRVSRKGFGLFQFLVETVSQKCPHQKCWKHRRLRRRRDGRARRWWLRRNKPAKNNFGFNFLFSFVTPKSCVQLFDVDDIFTFAELGAKSHIFALTKMLVHVKCQVSTFKLLRKSKKVFITKKDFRQRIIKGEWQPS